MAFRITSNHLPCRGFELVGFWQFKASGVLASIFILVAILLKLKIEDLIDLLYV